MPTNPVLATKAASVLLWRIQKSFPNLKWQEFKFIDAGWDHEIIQLDNKYIFRFPNSPKYVAMLRDEIELLAYLSDRVRARIPYYSYVAKDFSFGGYIMLPGEALSTERFHTLSEAQQNKAAKDIAEFLTDIHSINTAQLDKFSVGIEADFAGYGNVVAEADEYLKPNLSKDDYQVIVEMLNDIVLVQKYPRPLRLIHDDIAPKHLIWDDTTEKVGFIDFSDRVISDPAYDFAELYTYGEAFVDKVYELYQGTDKNEQFLSRAKAYMKAIGIHSLANTYRTEKMQHSEAMRLLKIGVGLNMRNP